MRKFIFVLLAIVLNFNAWGGTPTTTGNSGALKKTSKCLFPKSKKRAPNWVCDAHDDNLAVAAVGSFAKSKAGIAFMEQMAAADARTQLAKKLREPVQKKNAGSDSALPTGISDEMLQGTRIIKKTYGPNGRLYVLLGLDEAGMQKLHESASTDHPEQNRK